MQQVASVAARSLIEGAQVGIVATLTPEIEAIEQALRDAGAEVNVLTLGYLGWQGEGRFDVLLVRVAGPDEAQAGGTQARRHIADLDALALSHRVIALADASLDVLMPLAPGVRDFVSPPYRPAEVVARVARVLREPAPEVVLRAGNLEVYVANRIVLVGGQPVDVTFGEFELLRALLAAHGSPVSRNGLLGHAPPADRAAARWVDMHIHRLRGKLLGLQGARIDTVRGVGYRLGAA
jgi:DNA-binding response OmpR family regulator